MIIAFDTLMLAPRFRQVGIYEYARHLFAGFRALAARDPSLTIRYFVSPGYSEDFLFAEPVAGVEPVRSGLLQREFLWRHAGVSYAAARCGADLIFCPAPKILPLGAVPVAVTIHDVMPARLPASMLGVRTSYGLRFDSWVAAKLSQKILTDSEHSKRDLVEVYQIPPEKVAVVYLGYNAELFNSSPADRGLQQRLLARLGISGPFILHHGMVQLRKNLVRLIGAYETLLRDAGLRGLQLVLAGPMGHGAKKIRRAAAACQSGNIVFTGPLPEDELATLVKSALMCVIPSLYEGFCLPLVEAMACGIPAVAADSSCLREISAGGLRYLDPHSEEDMAASMAAVLHDSALQRSLAEHGLRRASEFSWRRCAAETLAVLTGAEAVVPAATVSAAER